MTQPTTAELGQQAEHVAQKFLEQQGLKFITHNYACRMGEIDLVMRDQACLVFVEVRYRRHTVFGSALTSITTTKQMKLIKTAHYYLQRHRLTEKIACRFDIVAMTPQQAQAPRIEWVKNAFLI